MKDIITKCYEMFDFNENEIVIDVKYDNKQLYITYIDEDGLITNYIPDLSNEEGQNKLKYIFN